MSVTDVENLRLHYAQTLAHWVDRFAAAEEQVVANFGDEFARAWRLYLSGSRSGLRHRLDAVVPSGVRAARVGTLPRGRDCRSPRRSGSRRVIRCDVLIVGGGPAGSTCARELRIAGWDVVVADRARFPRDKVCAGWLTPRVFQLLELDPEEYRATGLTLQEISGLPHRRHRRVVSSRLATPASSAMPSVAASSTTSCCARAAARRARGPADPHAAPDRRCLDRQRLHRGAE